MGASPTGSRSSSANTSPPQQKSQPSTTDGHALLDVLSSCGATDTRHEGWKWGAVDARCVTCGTDWPPESADWLVPLHQRRGDRLR